MRRRAAGGPALAAAARAARDERRHARRRPRSSCCRRCRTGCATRAPRASRRGRRRRAPKFQARVRASSTRAGAPIGDYRVRARADARPPTLNSQTDARVLVLDDDARCPATATEPPPGFLYDSEFSSQPPRAVRARARGRAAGAPVTELDGDTVIVAAPLSRRRRADRRAASPSASSPRSRRSSTRCATRFLIAAVVGLAVAALLAIALSSTLLRRLARLRAAALRITRRGPRRADAARRAPRRGRRPRPRARPHAGGAAPPGGRAARVRLDRLARAAHAADDAPGHDGAARGGHPRAAGSTSSTRCARSTTARRELDRLSTLVGELLDLSRLDAAVPLRSEPVELGEIVRAVAAEFELRAARALDVDRRSILPDGAVLGPRRPGRGRPRRADPARQRAALRPARGAGAGRGARRARTAP